MSARCPNGHLSGSTDYCDTCGAPLVGGGLAVPGPATAGPEAPGEAGAVCPNGHRSAATDYCDTCGVPMTAGDGGGAGSGDLDGADAGVGSGGAPSSGAPSAGAPGAGAPTTTMPSTAAGARHCPNCGAGNSDEALFCEACGYDFTTGAKPRLPAGASAVTATPTPTSPAAQPAPTPVPQPAEPTPDSPAATQSPSAAATAVMASASSDPSQGASSQAGASIVPSVALEWVVERWVDPSWYALQDSTEPCPSPGLPVVVPLTVRSALVGRVSFSRHIRPTIDCGPDIGVSRRHAQLTTDGTRWWIEDLQSSNGTYVGSDSGPLPTQPLVPGTRKELDEGDRVYLGAWTRLVVRRATDEEKAAGA